MSVLKDRLPAVRRPDLWIALGLFALGVLSRLPFRSQLLHHWDSVNFALAIEHFDVRLHQPHPPGTFVIYIMLGRLINWVLHDPNGSLVWISILTSGLSATLMLLLGKRWFDRRAGVMMALLALVSPLVWFHGEVALSYMLEFFWVVLMVTLCLAFYKGSDAAFYTSALCLGLAGGIRPNTPVFLFPLWAALVLMSRQPIRKILVALVVMTVGVAVWVIPMVLMSGGPAAYWEIMQWWGDQHLEKSSDANMLVYTARFGVFTVYALGFALVPMVWGVCRYWRELKRLLLTDWRAQMLVFWIGPAAGYFIFVHLKQPGHTFTIMPALVIVAALATTAIGRDLEKHSRYAWIAVAAIVIGGNSLLFLLGPPTLFDSSRSIFSTPTWASIREYDEDIGDRLEAIRETFGAEETAVFAGSRYFRLPDFYLNDFQMPSLSHQLDGGSVVLPEHIHTLVLFDDSVLPQLSDGPLVRSVTLPEGDSLRYVTWDGTKKITLSQEEFTVEDR